VAEPPYPTISRQQYEEVFPKSMHPSILTSPPAPLKGTSRRKDPATVKIRSIITQSHKDVGFL